MIIKSVKLLVNVLSFPLTTLFLMFFISDGNMFTALHIASFKGHLSIVEMLVAFDNSIIDWVNKYGHTALLTASSSCKADVVKFLLDNNAAITEDYEYLNCLDWSVEKNDEKSAMMMMCHDRWKDVRKNINKSLGLEQKRGTGIHPLLQTLTHTHFLKTRKLS